MKKLLILLILLSPSVTYAAEALWGTIDEPIEDVLQKPDGSVEQLIKPVTAPAPTPQKTSCEVILQQANLGVDVLGSSKLQDQIKNITQSSKPEYKMVLSNPDSIKKLYQQFREQYIMLNCKK